MPALRYENWKPGLFEQKAEGLKVSQEPSEEILAPLLTNPSMDPSRARLLHKAHRIELAGESLRSERARTSEIGLNHIMNR